MNKYPSVKEKIRHTLETEPNKYLQADLARKLGISREYIRQVVDGLNIRHLLGVRTWRFVCPGCGKHIHRNVGLCKECWLKEAGSPILSIPCDSCGKIIERKEYLAKRTKLHFCNRFCFGSYVGTHYGWGSGRPHKRKVDPDSAFSLWEETRWEGVRIAKVFGVSATTIYEVLSHYPSYKNRLRGSHPTIPKKLLPYAGEVYCPISKLTFSSPNLLSHHRAKTDELNSPSVRRRILGYRREHTSHQTLSYFHISKETLNSIIRGVRTDGR